MWLLPHTSPSTMRSISSIGSPRSGRRTRNGARLGSDHDLPAAPRATHRVSIKPAGDAAALLTHLLTERVLVGLYQAVIESAASEQLARMYTMRLAAENARRLVDRLTLEYNLARRNAITAAVLEVAAGYEATAGEAVSDAGPASRTGP